MAILNKLRRKDYRKKCVALVTTREKEKRETCMWT
jgi:hypothetical protein